MSQTANPLDQLKDIHIPEAINSWGLAPGWIISIILFCLALIYLIYRRRQKKPSKLITMDLLTPANQELNDIAKLTPDHLAIAKLSGLLKRVCLLSFPRQQVAALSGNAWLSFLNQQSESAFFTEEQQNVFCQQAYQANVKLEQDLWKNLIKTSQAVIESIITQKPENQSQ